MIQLQNAINRGFKVDRESILAKLDEEIQELKESSPADEFIVNHPVFHDKTTQDIALCFFKNKPIRNKSEDRYNADFYEDYFKDTEIGELGDIITVCITRLQELGINVESLIETIAIYNELRED
jgi:hypothetical protein